MSSATTKTTTNSAGTSGGTYVSGSSPNQRRTPRRVFKRPVGVLMGGTYCVLQGVQLSEGGMLLSRLAPSGEPGLAPTAAGKGTRLTVTLILPSGSMMVLRAMVIYPEEGPDRQGMGDSFGIKFDSVPLNQRRDIRNYVSSKLASEV